MATELEFFFDYGSPFSYLADTQLKGLAERTGALVVYRPMKTWPGLVLVALGVPVYYLWRLRGGTKAES